jgi:hypothetical protein
MINKLSSRIIFYENLGFGIVFLFLWLDEILDIPYHFFGAPATPINWRESIIESSVTLLTCIIVNYCTLHLMKKIKHLEGFVSICSECNRIRCGGKWIPLDEFLEDHSEAHLTHGYCEDCAKEFLHDFKEDKKHPKGPSLNCFI